MIITDDMNREIFLAKSDETSLEKHISNNLEVAEKILGVEKLEKFQTLSERSVLSKKDQTTFLNLIIFFHDVGKLSKDYQTFFRKNSLPNWSKIVPHSIVSALLLHDLEIEEILRSHLNLSELSRTEQELIFDKLIQLFRSALKWHHFRPRFLTFHREISREDFVSQLLSARENLKIWLSRIDRQKFLKFNIDVLKIRNGLNVYDSEKARKFYTELYLGLSEEKLYPFEIRDSFSLQVRSINIRSDHLSGTKIDKFISLKDIRAEIKEKLKEKFQSFSCRWQEKLIEILKEKHFDRNLVLVAPTGIGKTEFSLLWAIEALSLTPESETVLFYTLPIRAATNNLFSRLKNLFSSEKEKKLTLIHSSALSILEQTYQKADIELESLFDLSKELMYPLTLSTADQIFPFALKAPLYERAYGRFVNSVVVLDEPQVYDKRALSIILRFLLDLEQLKSQNLRNRWLLMTATLPIALLHLCVKSGLDFVLIDLYRQLLFDSSDLRKLYHKKGHVLDVFLRSSEAFTESNKKAVLKPKRIDEVFSDEEKAVIFDDPKHIVEYHFLSLKERDSENEYLSELKRKIVELIESSKSSAAKKFLIILNEVARAQNVFCFLEKYFRKEANIKLLHSRYTENDRKEHEKEALEIEKSKSFEIVVSTQVIEASVDISADVLITEFAPYESLIQRMGRINRRSRFSKSNISKSNVFIVIPSKEIKAVKRFSSVYSFSEKDSITSSLETTFEILFSKFLSEKKKELSFSEALSEKKKYQKIINLKFFEKLLTSEAEYQSFFEKRKSIEKEFEEEHKSPKNFKEILKKAKKEEKKKDEEIKKILEELYAKIFYEERLEIFKAEFPLFSQREAQKLFREIDSVDAIFAFSKEVFFNSSKSIPDRFLKFVSDLLDLALKKPKIKASEFRKELLSSYVVSVPYYLKFENFKESETDEEQRLATVLADEIQKLIDFLSKNENSEFEEALKKLNNEESELFYRIKNKFLEVLKDSENHFKFQYYLEMLRGIYLIRLPYDPKLGASIKPEVFDFSKKLSKNTVLKGKRMAFLDDFREKAYECL